jgi:tetratricopeptide (TPR) repeat protein
MKGEYDESIRYSELSIEVDKTLENPVAVANTLHLIGSVYYHQGKTDKALYYFKKYLAFQMSPEEHSPDKGQNIERVRKVLRKL